MTLNILWLNFCCFNKFPIELIYDFNIALQTPYKYFNLTFFISTYQFTKKHKLH